MFWPGLSNLSVEEKQAITALESEDEGFVHSFRSIIRQLVNLFDHSHSEAQAKLRLQQLRHSAEIMSSFIRLAFWLQFLNTSQAASHPCLQHVAV